LYLTIEIRWTFNHIVGLQNAGTLLVRTQVIQFPSLKTLVLLGIEKHIWIQW